MKRVCCVLVLAALAPLVNAQVLTEDPSKRRVIPESMALQSHQTEHWMRSIPVHSNVTAQMRSLGINLRKFIVPPAGTLRENGLLGFGSVVCPSFVILALAALVAMPFFVDTGGEIPVPVRPFVVIGMILLFLSVIGTWFFIVFDIIHAARNPAFSGGAKVAWICAIWTAWLPSVILQYSPAKSWFLIHMKDAG